MHVRTAAVTGVIIAALLLWMHGSRLIFTCDEGIILEAAQRMASGKRLYVDFFGYMSPGSYWLQELVFRLFGVSVWTGRLIVILDFGVQCAVLYWLTAKLATRVAAAVTLGFFVVLQVSFPALITAQHRWDSAALAMLAIAFAIGGRPILLFFSGVFAVAAAACTPSLALIGAVTGLWLLIRKRLLPFTLGCAAAGVAIISLMVATGIWAGFLAQMEWLRQNYSAVNVMPYGSIIGGYRALFDTSGPELILRAGLVFCLALPAILPVVSTVLWTLARFQGSGDRWTISYLVASMVAFVVSAYPRPDVMHLAFIAPLGYCLTGVFFSRYLSARAAGLICIVPAAFSLLFLLNYVMGYGASRSITSPVGTLRAQLADERPTAELLKAVRAGDSLFVYPYMPLLYFVTQGRNPTSFSYLAPGMMTHREEFVTLRELKATPPKWILYLPVSRAEFLRLFPNATGLSSRFELLENWITETYVQVLDQQPVSGYRLMTKAQGQR